MLAPPSATVVSVPVAAPVAAAPVPTPLSVPVSAAVLAPAPVAIPAPVTAPAPAPAPISPRTPQMEASDRGKVILDQLLSANKSYVAGDSLPQSKLSPPSLRKDLADNGQQPCAAIIACADSRVAPEIVFGAGLGSVFVVRNAGNVVWEDSNAGSLEFAVSVLKVPLVIVLGHTMCGAVGAAVCACKSPSCPEEESPLAKHVARIARVVKNAVGGQEEIRDAVLMNVRNGVECLREGSTAVGDAFRNGAVSVVGAVYDIASGEVFVIDQ